MRYEFLNISDIFLKLDQLGIFSLSVCEAADLVAKILCLEGFLDVHAPKRKEGNSIYDPELNELLIKEVVKYQKIIITGIKKGTLIPEHISYDIEDEIVSDETIINFETLVDWFAERGVHIEGDFCSSYQDDQQEILEVAIEAIIIKSEKIRNKIKESPSTPEQEKIAFLEREIMRLRSQIPRNKVIEKDLGTRERNALYKMIICMAIKGYGYNPHAKKSYVPKDIEGDFRLLGLETSAETIRKYLNKAYSDFPVSIKKT